MDAAQALALLQPVIDALTGIANTGAPPPGYVFVKPTGPLGAGKVRLWPAVENPQNGVTEGPWGYAYRLAGMNPPLFDRGRAMMVSATVTKRGLTIPEACDFLTHPQEWKTQAELDEEDALAARDAAAGSTFSPG